MHNLIFHICTNMLPEVLYLFLLYGQWAQIWPAGPPQKRRGTGPHCPSPCQPSQAPSRSAQEVTSTWELAVPSSNCSLFTLSCPAHPIPPGLPLSCPASPLLSWPGPALALPGLSSLRLALALPGLKSPRLVLALAGLPSPHLSFALPGLNSPHPALTLLDLAWCHPALTLPGLSSPGPRLAGLNLPLPCLPLLSSPGPTLPGLASPHPAAAWHQQQQQP